MDLYEAIQTRLSVRRYLPAPVEPDKLSRMWEAVRLAPSACNLQPWRFLVLQSPEARLRTRGVVPDWAYAAPVLVVALGNTRQAWHRDGESIHSVDVAIAVEHLILAAAAEGLGTCWICAFDRLALRRNLALEPEWDPVAIIPVGYADDHNPRSQRKPLNNILLVT